MTNLYTRLARQPSDAARKRCILRWRDWGLIPDARARHLIAVFELEAA